MDSADAEGTLGDKTDDWLWDLEDRYDLGAVGDHFAKKPDAVADDPRLANVRSYRRTRNGVEGSSGVDETGHADDMTVANAAMYEPRPLAPVRRSRPQRRHVRGRALAAASLVVIGLGGVAMAATRHSGSGRSGRSGEPNVAIGTPTSQVAVLVGPPGVTVTQPPSTITPSTPPVGIPTESGQPSGTDAPAGAVFIPTGNTSGGRTTQPPASSTPGTPGTSAPPPVTTPVTTPTTVVQTTVPTTLPKPPPATTVPTVPPEETTVPTETTVPHPFG